MNFGEKLRQLRQERQWTQPDLAEKLGIEQSWLSKIENDKSAPSSDLLQKIEQAFAIPLSELLSGLDEDYVTGTLSSLPEVKGILQQNRYQVIHRAKRWILAASTSLALGCALFFAAAAQLFFSDTVYIYESPGIVYESEPQTLFEDRNNLAMHIALGASQSLPPDEAGSEYDNTSNRITLEIVNREKLVQVISENFLGNSFRQDEVISAGATDIYGTSMSDSSQAYRLFYKSGDEEVRHPTNGVLFFAGIFFAIMGIGLFVGELRISRLAKR